MDERPVISTSLLNENKWRGQTKIQHRHILKVLTNTICFWFWIDTCTYSTKARVRVLLTPYNGLRPCHQRPTSPRSSAPHTHTGAKKIPFKEALAQTIEYRVWTSAVGTRKNPGAPLLHYSGVGSAQLKTVWVTSWTSYFLHEPPCSLGRRTDKATARNNKETKQELPTRIPFI